MLKLKSVLFLLALSATSISLAAPKPKPTPTPITALPYTISAPGTYILLSDLPFSIPGGTAITIAAGNVVLDLQGHKIYDVLGTSLNADPNSTGVDIYGSNATYPVTVRNGTIDHFDIGV